MDIYGQERSGRGRARERINARQSRQMATRRNDVLPIDATDEVVFVPERSPRTERPAMQRSPIQSPLNRLSRFSRAADSTTRPSRTLGARIEIVFHDLWWHVRHDVRLSGALIAIIVFAIGGYIGSHVFGARVFPNVWAMGINLGDRTVDEAAAALQSAWDRDIRIELTDLDRRWAISPAELGLRLNARATVESARAVGMSGIPFGYNVLPTVEMDTLRAQNTLLNLSDVTKIIPYNAGYRWEGETLLGVPGTDGRFLDVAVTMSELEENLAELIDARTFALVMNTVSPDTLNPQPYLDQARVLTSQPFQMMGYDPFTDERIMWSTDRDTFTSWIEVGETGLTLRETAFVPFLDAQTASLSQTDALRYLEPTDAMDKMRAAIGTGANTVNLRVRYRTTTYTIQGGDSGYGIARQIGVPFYLVEDANRGLDWNSLSAGDVINLPSPDAVLPLEPVPSKRIVVNLNTQSLYAYENGQLVFNWLISSGMDHVPTSPGIYQILNHDEQATGSSVELCGDNSCGTWEMYWFMGIYEVYPGLINGFHGAVLLPNGAYLGGNNVGNVYTYGCVMSLNENAEQLYRWAEEGTMVEIISSEFAPRSEIGRLALSQASVPTAPIG